ncbi:hypothetical protein ACFXJ5_17025 [Streptomyces sp. NPDC059373]
MSVQPDGVDGIESAVLPDTTWRMASCPAAGLGTTAVTVSVCVT